VTNEVLKPFLATPITCFGQRRRIFAQNPRMNGKADNSDFNAFEVDLGIGAGKAGVAESDRS
jgi:hypothetical protein